MLTAQEQEHSSISLLAEVSRTITHEDDINKVLRLVLFIMSENMNMLRGMITILNRDSGEIVINESFGLTEKEKERGRYQIGEGVIGHVVKTGKAVIVPSIENEPLFLDRTRSRAKAKKESLCFICIPIKAGMEIIGTLSADRQLETNTGDKNTKAAKAGEKRTDMLQHYVDQLSIIASMISQAVRIKQLAHEESEKKPLEAKITETAARQNSLPEKHDEETLSEAERPSNIIGNTKPMVSLYKMIDKIAKTNATTLVLGESGVGKELVASAIHFKSHRVDKPFIKFNCAALPESIVESELFGHEKGAFT
ncbi:MAG: sigma 54-interacting transcriptional regulator, partial [Chlorobiaceae bacterium]